MTPRSIGAKKIRAVFGFDENENLVSSALRRDASRVRGGRKKRDRARESFERVELRAALPARRRKHLRVRHQGRRGDGHARREGEAHRRDARRASTLEQDEQAHLREGRGDVRHRDVHLEGPARSRHLVAGRARRHREDRVDRSGGEGPRRQLHELREDGRRGRRPSAGQTLRNDVLPGRRDGALARESPRRASHRRAQILRKARRHHAVFTARPPRRLPGP
jgi:hypothetical protein